MPLFPPPRPELWRNCPTGHAALESGNILVRLEGMPNFDILLRGGHVIDGTGAARVLADVAIAGDRVAAIGALAGAQAKVAIDCAGLIVCPGFVDVHNHSDGWLLSTRNLASKTMQGVTTEVLMSDGISYAPVSEATAPHWLYYLRALDGLQVSDYRGWRSIADYMALLDRATAQNTVAQVCYANVRTLAMGWERHGPDDYQVRRMQALVREGMEQGATGISTGLDYISQCFATTDELAEVCSAMQPWQGVYVTHVRYKKGTVEGVREAVEIGRRAGVPVHISHLKGSNEREAEEVLHFIDTVAVREVDFTFDVYPYLPGSTMLNMLLPYEAWSDGPLGVTAKLSDPELRRRFADNLADYRTSPDKIRLGWVAGKANARYQGLSLAEYARAVGKPLADALCDLLIDERLAVLCVFHVGDDRLVEPFLDHPKYMFGSDGIFFADGIVHPRQYGSAPRILGPLVRDRRLFTLEEAVRKLTSMPATRFGLRDRGLLAEGAFADVVVFDPATIADKATYLAPHAYSEGVAHVFVNGQGVVRHGVPVEFGPGPCPGRALKFEAR